MNTNTESLSSTFYFGLSVEVIYRMETYSWVRFCGQDLIVDTDDLVPVQRVQPGLPSPLFSGRPCPEPVLFQHARIAATR